MGRSARSLIHALLSGDLRFAAEGSHGAVAFLEREAARILAVAQRSAGSRSSASFSVTPAAAGWELVSSRSSVRSPSL